MLVKGVNGCYNDGKYLFSGVMSVEELLLKKRDISTTGAVNALRKSGYVPGVIYGDSKDAEPISVSELSLMKTIESGSISKVFHIDCDGQKLRAVIKDVQFHPVSTRPLSVDFLRVTKGAKVNIKVRVNFLNENLSPAIKKGGVLNVAIHEVLLACDIDHVPESLDVDISGIDFHHAVKVRDLPLPEGARCVNLTDDLTVATVVAPSGLRSEMNKEAADDAAAAAGASDKSTTEEK